MRRGRVRTRDLPAPADLWTSRTSSLSSPTSSGSTRSRRWATTTWTRRTSTGWSTRAMRFDQCHVTAASCAPARASLFKGLLPAYHGDPQERRPLAPLVDRAAQRRRLPLHQRRQDAHLAVRDRAGIRRAVRRGEQGPVPRGPLLLRRVGQGAAVPRAGQAAARAVPAAARLPGPAAGGLRVAAARGHAPRRVRRRHGRLVAELAPARSQPLFLEIGFPGPHPPYDPVPRYAEPYLQKELPLLEVTAEELEEPAAGAEGAANSQHRGRPRFGRPRSSNPSARGSGTASVPTTWPT